MSFSFSMMELIPEPKMPELLLFKPAMAHRFPRDGYW